MTYAQTIKYNALRSKVTQAYKTWQSCTDKAKKEKLGDAWVLANKKAEAYADKYMKIDR